MTSRSAGVLRWTLAILMTAGVLACCVGVLALLATDEQGMLSRMQAFSRTEQFGVPASNYPALAQSLAGYLRGGIATPQVNIITSVGERLAFNERELLHLADIVPLVRLGRMFGIAGFGLVSGIAAALLAIRYGASDAASQIQPSKVVKRALLLLAGIVLAIVTWAAMNFDGLFVTFHHLLFTNDLWLLNPQTDLLLQLMPTAFFTSYAKSLGLYAAILLVLLGALAVLLRNKPHKRVTKHD